MDFVISALQERHLDALAAIERDVFDGPWSRAMLAEDVRAGNALCLAALRRHEIIGYVSAWLAADECTINRIACSRRYQRRGVGTLLLRNVLQQAAKRGATACFLDVQADNAAALGLYARAGFQPCGLRRNYYNQTGGDAVLMSMPLQPGVWADDGSHAT